MKILYVDPWCANGSNLYYYSTGLIEAVSAYADVVMVVQKSCDIPKSAKYQMWNLFFSRSSKMKNSIFRTVVRGFEYLWAYWRIERKTRKEHFDIIHIEWPLVYKLDAGIYRRLKKNCKKLSLKAHNILPHSTGDRYVEAFRKIYEVPDVILVHGKNMIEDFKGYYQEYIEKVQVQHDGVLANFDCSFDVDCVDKKIIDKIMKYRRLYLFVGRIDADKGLDRFVRAWRKGVAQSNSLLIIAGKTAEGYNADVLKRSIDNSPNIVLIDEYIPDNLLNYLMYTAHLIVLPYIKGSMSAVAITAAEYAKPVFSTRFGVIEEYIRDEVDGFIVENNYDAIANKLKYIDSKVADERLIEMGKEIKNRFEKDFNWGTIGQNLVENVYKKLLKE